MQSLFWKEDNKYRNIGTALARYGSKGCVFGLYALHLRVSEAKLLVAVTYSDDDILRLDEALAPFRNECLEK